MESVLADEGRSGGVEDESSPPISLLGGILGAVVLLVFLSTLAAGFVNFDDELYFNNPEVMGGLSPATFRDAIAKPHYTDWAPLTRLSYLLDASLYGANPWGFHLTNVLLHAAASVGLFLAWAAMTGCVWRSFVAMMLFAIHPLRVESVAWVSERKDVLSVFFLALALIAYERYVRRPSHKTMFVVAAAMLASLMAKSTLVTLPLLLLVLDAWPLGRWQEAERGGGGWLAKAIPLVKEKTVLFMMAAGFAGLTIQTQASAIQTDEAMPLFSTRLPTALFAPVRYAVMTIWPSGLHARYTHPGGGAVPPAWWIAGVTGCGVLIAIAMASRNKIPAVSSGLTWFGVSLLPVCGLVKHVGMHSHADRYTYVPHVGLMVAIVWAACESATRTSTTRLARAIGFLVAACWIAVDQGMIATWRDSESLWSNVLLHEPGNDFAAEGLIQHHLSRGRVGDALSAADRIAARHAGTTAFIEIAEAQAAEGDVAGAAETCRREAMVKMRCHGEQNPATLEAVVRHVTSLRNAGDPAAESMAQALEPALRRTLGVGHLATLRVLVINAGAANRRLNPHVGERYAREVLEAAARSRQSLPEITKPAAIALAESLDLQGRTDEAGAVLVEMIERTGGLEGRLAAVNSQLAIAHAAHLARTGRLDDARALLTTLAERVDSILGSTHPAARRVRGFLEGLREDPTDE